MDVGCFSINQQADKPTNSVCIYRKKATLNAAGGICELEEMKQKQLEREMEYMPLELP